MARDWLVVHDYGLGGSWAVITADMQAEITTRYRDLAVHHDRPRFISDSECDEIRTKNHYDVDDVPEGWHATTARSDQHGSDRHE